MSYYSDYAARHAGIDEPCTIDAKTVADYLARQDKPGMADWVRRCGQRIDALIAEVADLSARLNKLQPPQRTHTPDIRRTGD